MVRGIGGRVLLEEGTALAASEQESAAHAEVTPNAVPDGHWVPLK